MLLAHRPPLDLSWRSLGLLPPLPLPQLLLPSPVPLPLPQLLLPPPSEYACVVDVADMVPAEESKIRPCENAGTDGEGEREGGEGEDEEPIRPYESYELLLLPTDLDKLLLPPLSAPATPSLLRGLQLWLLP